MGTGAASRPTRRSMRLSMFVIALLLTLGNPLAAATSGQRTVVVLLFDGWAPALLDTIPAPTLARLRQEGAWTHHLVPAFPSISMVNQVTQSTGCWPQSHGIVSNVFRDPQRGIYDHSVDADWLTGCEHLPQVAERQGVRTAALGWIGRYSETRGKLATYITEERTRPDYPDDTQRAEQVISMLQLPDAERPHLILGYFKGPDSAEHFTGMDSEETEEAVKRSDALVGKILQAIDALPFRNQITLIITTDHGMLPVSTNVNVSKILRNQDIDAQFLSAGTSSFLYFSDPRDAQQAHEKLVAYQRYFTTHTKTDQPRDWQIGSGPRVGDLILSTVPPYFIEDVSRWPAGTRWLGSWGPELIWARFVIKASHGYPARTPGMSGIWYAWGGGIARGQEVISAAAIDVHPTVCRLLGIEPGVPVDGTVAASFLDEGLR